MARYSASGTQTLQATDDDSTDATALTIAAQSTAHQNRIYEIWFANIGAPADLVSVYTVARITAATTTAAGTTVTPSLIDLADRASQSKSLENCTTEPTYTSNQELLEIPLNHRATFRWVSAPGGELVTPATNNAGAGFKAIHASATTDFRMGAMWEE
jgi:adenine deaminase